MALILGKAMTSVDVVPMNFFLYVCEMERCGA
jgi:hypothetical protein